MPIVSSLQPSWPPRKKCHDGRVAAEKRACSVAAIVPLVVPRLGVGVGEALEAPRVGVLAIAVLCRAKNGLCMPRRQRRRREACALELSVASDHGRSYG